MSANKKIVIVGGAGNVGKGITRAFTRHSWKCEVIDPKLNTVFERITTPGLKKVFFSVDHVVYVAEIGNRDSYHANPKLEKENNFRFKNFCKQVFQINHQIIIWYVGGSWTKRKPNKRWVVNDRSSNKFLTDCNDYEKAKISAEKNAKKLSKLIKIRFLDWASIIPNISENFSIPKMANQALSEGIITYSAGVFGRPLLDSTQAGQALNLLIKNDDKKKSFETFLIPGIFTPFSKFASSVKKVIEKEKGGNVKLDKQTSTPDFLKTKTQSDYLEKIGFNPKKEAILKALEKNAYQYIKNSKSHYYDIS